MAGFSTPSSETRKNLIQVGRISSNPLTPLPFSFGVVPRLDSCLAKKYELKITKEVNSSRNEENDPPLHCVRLESKKCLN
jgi:hypothetical protein